MNQSVPMRVGCWWLAVTPAFVASIAIVFQTLNYTNTAGDCLARMVLVTANHNPHACRLLAGLSINRSVYPQFL